MTAVDVKNKLYKYTPAFVETSPILEGLYTAIADTIFTLSNAVQNLTNIEWSGKGLKKNASLNHIIYNNASGDSSIENNLMSRFIINKARGTASGIIADLFNLFAHTGMTIELFNPNQCGLIVDGTYPGVDVQCVIDINKAIYVSEGNNILTESSNALIQESNFYIYEEGNVNGDLLNNLGFVKSQVIPIDTQIIYDL